MTNLSTQAQAIIDVAKELQMTENPKWVAVFYHYRQPAPILTEIKELEHFRQICEHFPTDWAHLIEVETGKILDTYNKEEYEE